MRRPTKAQLRERLISNPYGLAATQPEPRVAVEYYPEGDHSNPRWVVFGVGFKVYPEGTWSQDGNRVFVCFRPSEDKESKLSKAIEWATGRYGITDWERSPFGSYHPVGTMARAMGWEPVETPQ